MDNVCDEGNTWYFQRVCFPQAAVWGSSFVCLRNCFNPWSNIVSDVLPKGKGGILEFPQSIPGKSERESQSLEVLWDFCHVFLSSWISGLIAFVSVNLILCLGFITAGVYPIEKKGLFDYAANFIIGLQTHSKDIKRMV